jgi:hypothetical protein
MITGRKEKGEKWQLIEKTKSNVQPSASIRVKRDEEAVG